MKNILTSIFLLGVIACSDSEYYKVQFENVHGLETGNKAFIKGLEVGEVKDLVIDDEQKVLATIWVGRNIKLTKGSTITIHSDLLGPRYIEINLAGNQGLMNPNEIQQGYVQPGDTIGFRKYTKEERDSLVKNNPIFRLADTVFHMLRKSRATTPINNNE